MYSNQNQAVIVSSKRHTAYQAPTTSSGDSTTKENGSLKNETNPFPVDHIASSKLINNSNLSTGTILFKVVLNKKIFTYLNIIRIFKKVNIYIYKLFNFG